MTPLENPDTGVDYKCRGNPKVCPTNSYCHRDKANFFGFAKCCPCKLLFDLLNIKNISYKYVGHQGKMADFKYPGSSIIGDYHISAIRKCIEFLRTLQNCHNEPIYSL